MKIRSDNGTEFKNMKIEEWCDEEGIKHELSATYTPQQIGVVERKNKTLITLVRAMLDDYGTSKKFWVEAINMACHASNRVYPHRLLKKTPYEGSVSLKVDVMKVSFLVMRQTPKHIEYSIKPPLGSH